MILFVLVRLACADTKDNQMWWQVSSKSGVLAVFISVLYAASDELHQSFVPGRTASTGDVLVDALGVGLAWLGWCLLG